MRHNKKLECKTTSLDISEYLNTPGTNPSHDHDLIQLLSISGEHRLHPDPEVAAYRGNM